MKIVVTDHHNITDAMADCLLINPKRPGGVYPFKELSGCGVAFKTAQLIQKKAGLPKSVLSEVLDLVAIGTVGDIMPLLDENRTMVKFGLKMINTGHRYGLRKLIEGAAVAQQAQEIQEHRIKLTEGLVQQAVLLVLRDGGRIEQQRVGGILLQKLLHRAQLVQNAHIAAVFLRKLEQRLAVAGGINHGCPPDSQ